MDEVTKSGRGVLYIYWGNNALPYLRRSVESLNKWHPELPVKAIELKDAALPDKSAMYDLSPFAETLFLDIDTVVMGRLDFGFDHAKRNGSIACCICENPWLRRYQEESQIGDAIEYNSGVVFFTEGSKPIFDLWKQIAVNVSGDLEFMRSGEKAVMPQNDQQSFSLAIRNSGCTPAILPLNWNFSPSWHSGHFGPIKIWRDYREPPLATIEFSESQSKSGEVIDFRHIVWGQVKSADLDLDLGELPLREAYPLDQIPGDCKSITAEHILQKFSHRKTLDVLIGWARALKEGGTLRVSVPDFRHIAKAVVANVSFPVDECVMGTHGDKDDHNGAVFSREALRGALLKIGLRHVRPWFGKNGNGIIGLEADKPIRTEVRNTIAVMTAPRSVPRDHVHCAFNAFLDTHVRYQISGGAYWQHAIAGLMEDAAEHYDYVISCDSDVLFTSQDVRDLYRLIRDNPHADAIAAVHVRRGDGMALFVDTEADPKQTGPRQIDRTRFDAELFPSLSAHFGLTIFRSSSLKKLAHPWFVGKPNEEGRWRNGQTDPDTAFWEEWRKAGMTLFIAPWVNLGHCEYQVAWFGEDGKVFHQAVNDYLESGMPIEARQ
jgi:hypothetical protein